jgi:hypothetical protein
MCANGEEGLFIIKDNFENVMSNLCIFLNHRNDMKKVIFPAATVLLDLTANESYVEIVGKFLYE